MIKIVISLFAFLVCAKAQFAEKAVVKPFTTMLILTNPAELVQPWPAPAGPLPGGNFGIMGATNLVSRVESNGVVTLTFKRHDICFAAVYPGCPGHDVVWSESFTNGIVKR